MINRSFIVWSSMLVLLLILVCVENTVPVVFNTVHIALILNNLNQLINTLQFLAAFEFMHYIELLMRIGTNRTEEVEATPKGEGSSSWDPASDAHSSTNDSELDMKINRLHQQRIIPASGSGTERDSSQGEEEYDPSAPEWQRYRTDGLKPEHFEEFHRKLSKKV